MKRSTLYQSFVFCLLLGLSLLIPSQALADDCPQITDKPNLYEVDQVGQKAALYFTPVNAQTTGYTINYGLSSGDDRYNVDFAYGNSTGAIGYAIDGLDTSMHYFFRVRAKNACSTGPYSDWVAANATGGLTTAQGGAATDSAVASGSSSFTATPVPTTPTTKVPVTGVSSMLLMSLAAVGLCGIGGLLLLGKRFSL